MAAAVVARSISKDSDDIQNEILDPRIYVELEKLNKASDDINRLEVELDYFLHGLPSCKQQESILTVFLVAVLDDQEARSTFRQVLTESTQQLNALAKKLGSCIDKARPYYDARINLKEAQIRTQNAALRYERACSQLTAAKEMVNLAEQGYFKMGQPFDPAWQEMLNHSTMKVNDAEQERLESEVEHQRTAQDFNDAEQLVKKLQKEWKRNIAKSRPYFETKAKVNQQMEEQKKKVAELEMMVPKAKMVYAEALHNLERISDDIHQKRREARHRRKRLSKQNGSNIIYHPLMNSSESSEEEIFIDFVPPNKQDAAENPLTELQMPNDPLNAVDVTLKTLSRTPDKSNKETNTLPSLDSMQSSKVQSSDAAERQKAKNAAGNPVVSLTATPLTPSGNSTGSPEADPDQIRFNAEIMATITQSKSSSMSRPYLRPNRSHDDFLCDGSSETESITSSFASAAMLDDEQIESLMLETTAYHDFLARMDSSESDQFKRMSLPGKLGYLKNYFNFEPIWVDDEHDLTPKTPSDPDDRDSVTGSAEDNGSTDPLKVQRRLLARAGTNVGGIAVSDTHYV